MRRIVPALLAAALPLSMLAFAPATSDDTAEDGTAAEETTEEAPATITPEPIDVTMYFHGNDGAQIIDEDAYASTGGILEMDRTAPADNSYETRQITNYVQGPNARCAGNGLLPVWVGFFGKGTMQGFGTVTLRVLGGTGGPVTIDVFTDVSGQACNEAYPEPVASATVNTPVGEGEMTAVLDLDGVRADAFLMVQVRGADGSGVDNPVGNPGAPIWPSRVAPTDPTGQGRVVYDGTSFLSNITFTCLPDDVTFDADGEPSHDPNCLPF